MNALRVSTCLVRLSDKSTLFRLIWRRGVGLAGDTGALSIHCHFEALRPFIRIFRSKIEVLLMFRVAELRKLQDD
jgi:hypothetical protein